MCGPMSSMRNQSRPTPPPSDCPKTASRTERQTPHLQNWRGGAKDDMVGNDRFAHRGNLTSAVSAERVDEVGVEQVAVAGDVRITAHGSLLHESAREHNPGVEALIALEAKLAPGAALVSAAVPVCADALPGPERHDHLHERQKSVACCPQLRGSISSASFSA